MLCTPCAVCVGRAYATAISAADSAALTLDPDEVDIAVERCKALRCAERGFHLLSASKTFKTARFEIPETP